MLIFIWTNEPRHQGQIYNPVAPGFLACCREGDDCPTTVTSPNKGKDKIWIAFGEKTF